MLPYIDIIGHQTSMYSIMCLTGIGLAIIVGVLHSKRTGVPKNDVFFSYLMGAIGLLVGGKIFYIASLAPLIAEKFHTILEHPEMLLVFTTGGFVFYGGIFGAILAVIIYCRKYRINSLALLDTIAPTIPLAHAFGRLGCFFAGCCYGRSYNGPLSVVFPEGSAAPAGIGLFPSQLAESAVNIIIFILLISIGSKKRKDGLLLGLYALLYATARFVLEFLRGDAERGIYLSISFSQWISIALLPLALYLIFGKRKARRISAPSQEAPPAGPHNAHETHDEPNGGKDRSI